MPMNNTSKHKTPLENTYIEHNNHCREHHMWGLPTSLITIGGRNDVFSRKVESIGVESFAGATDASLLYRRIMNGSFYVIKIRISKPKRFPTGITGLVFAICPAYPKNSSSTTEPSERKELEQSECRRTLMETRQPLRWAKVQQAERACSCRYRNGLHAYRNCRIAASERTTMHLPKRLVSWAKHLVNVDFALCALFLLYFIPLFRYCLPYPRPFSILLAVNS